MCVAVWDVSVQPFRGCYCCHKCRWSKRNSSHLYFFSRVVNHDHFNNENQADTASYSFRNFFLDVADKLVSKSGLCFLKTFFAWHKVVPVNDEVFAEGWLMDCDSSRWLVKSNVVLLKFLRIAEDLTAKNTFFDNFSSMRVPMSNMTVQVILPFKTAAAA